MLFNSYAFIGFFAAVFALYWMLPFRGQNWLLLGASYFFYGWWGLFTPELSGLERALPLLLLLLSTLATHFAARLVDAAPEHCPRRKLWFWLGVAVNLGLLGYFKYRGFFLENLQAAMAHLGWGQPSPVTTHFVLPAGISFYTFQGLSYLIDVHGGAQKPAPRLRDFALFHAYFPQLVAGPIERSRNLFPQITSRRTLSPEGLWTGVQLIIIGYLKKVTIADGIAPITTEVFGSTGGQTGLGLLLGIYLFALQIYGDFSGYSDIARGTSRILGIELMVNFRQPYFSRNITEFWERWHISLSTWLRDYVFVPLCRVLRGRKWINTNLFLTMLLSGLWHGASWNFLVWGALLGGMLVVHKIWSGPKSSKHPHRPKTAREAALQFAGAALTFHCVCLTLILVKSRDLPHAWSYLTGIAGGGASLRDVIPLIYVAFYGALAACIDFPCWWHNRELPVAQTAPAWRRGLVFGFALLLIAFLGEMKGVSFVYFQF
jgi:D-alanyl-lipoteichoic acid acyltransferase DltB (MBOAT superfamily)